ncbi:MAG: ring-cleaving dioxygenase [Desulfomonile tiedjei]|nr:ring-cleaving dioxygenase [Desulfomonile tiedjei]
MTEQIAGIHHVTAIAGEPQPNLDFYTGVLGLRLVKLTVNFDDPNTYHLYFGDDAGRPGTIMTFFPWPGGAKGRRGSGQVDIVSFAIPDGSMGFWMERFKHRGVRFEAPAARLDEEVLPFTDPDGLHLELVAVPVRGLRESQPRSTLPGDRAIMGFHGVTLLESDWRATDRLLHQTLGFRRLSEEGNRLRYGISAGQIGARVDVLRVPEPIHGRVAVGTVHHVAWRTPDESEQLYWQERLRSVDLNVTPVIDRKYFHSIYFREPGGTLFEIATDPPGFAVDEDPAELGTHLMLPSRFEARREAIQRALPRLSLPPVVRAA